MINRKKIKPGTKSIMVYPDAVPGKNQEPELTPDARKAIRKELEHETPPAEHHPTTPEQPLYQDKTEVYFQNKQNKSKITKS